MTTYHASPDGRDAEITLPRPLVDALIARKEMAEEAAEDLDREFREFASSHDNFGPWVDRLSDLLNKVTRPLDAIGQDVYTTPDSTCQHCNGAGKVDDLRLCFVCSGSGFAEDLSTLQLMV